MILAQFTCHRHFLRHQSIQHPPQTTNSKMALALGAGHRINHPETPKWSEQVLKITDRNGANNIIDVARSSTIAESFNAIQSGGIITQIGALPVHRGMWVNWIPLQGLFKPKGMLRGMLRGPYE